MLTIFYLDSKCIVVSENFGIFPLLSNRICKFSEDSPCECVGQTAEEFHLRRACQGKMNQTGRPRSA